jgi:deoxyribodipyrimidine photo-lyase
VGCQWSVAGVHDRPWPERKIFGKVRYMNERGCRRKFDVDEFVRRWLDGKS